jgi:hypothetical protein
MHNLVDLGGLDRRHCFEANAVASAIPGRELPDDCPRFEACRHFEAWVDQVRFVRISPSKTVAAAPICSEPSPVVGTPLRFFAADEMTDATAIDDLG